MPMQFRFVDNSNIILDKVSQNAEDAMDELADFSVEAVQEKMLYGYHTPHGPDGHTEILDTSKLFDSIAAEVQRQSQNLFAMNVGTDVKYAPFAHDGTAKLEGRPFISDALMETQEEQKDIMSRNLKKGF